MLPPLLLLLMQGVKASAGVTCLAAAGSLLQGVGMECVAGCYA